MFDYFYKTIKARKMIHYKYSFKQQATIIYHNEAISYKVSIWGHLVRHS